jgi:hypothetical protein
MYPEIFPGFFGIAVCVGGVGTGVAVPLPPTGASGSETLAFRDSGFESEGLSVLGGDVKP